MLDKLKIIMILELLFTVLRSVFPELNLDEEFTGALKLLVETAWVTVPVLIGWRFKERESTRDALVVR